MSTFRCPIVPIVLNKHPNADSLSIANIKGWQCVVKTDDFINETLGVYIPIDSITDKDHPFLSFLEGKKVKTIKLRSIISQGVLLPYSKVANYYNLNNPADIDGSENLASLMNIRKWVAPDCLENNGFIKMPSCDIPESFIKYTNIESYNNYPDVLQEGEQVIITSKIHGTNSRFALIDNKFYIGSHNCTILSVDEKERKSIYQNIFEKLNLRDKLFHLSLMYNNKNIEIFGEIYGKGIQDLQYGLEEPEFLLFDIRIIYDDSSRYLNYAELEHSSKCVDLPLVPLLYRGTFDKNILSLRQGLDPLSKQHIQEGIVIRPEMERFDSSLGRVILKYINEEYLLRKKAKDR